jgi:hypothetical protein
MPTVMRDLNARFASGEDAIIFGIGFDFYVVDYDLRHSIPLLTKGVFLDPVSASLH